MKVAYCKAGMKLFTHYFPSLFEIIGRIKHLNNLNTEIIIFQEIPSFYTGIFGKYILIPLLSLLRTGFPISCILLFLAILEGKICSFYKIDFKENLELNKKNIYPYCYYSKKEKFYFTDNGLLILSKKPLSVNNLEKAQIASINDKLQIINTLFQTSSNIDTLISNTSNMASIFFGDTKNIKENLPELIKYKYGLISNELSLNQVKEMDYYNYSVPIIFELE